MMEFAGWLMPVQYTSILQEHSAVRRAAGLFDLCHMGQIEIGGDRALEQVQLLTTNDASRLAVGQAQYTLLCYEDGGVVDDVLVYRIPQSYLVVVNAANTAKDYRWIRDRQLPGTQIDDVSEHTGMLALQGPLAQKLLQPLADFDLANLAYFHCAPGSVCGIRCLVARTGYTGEDGFELLCASGETERLWRGIVERGSPRPQPCGLGARDTLRLEAKLSLYGHELDETTNPLEAGLAWAVKFDKPDFIGKKALLAIKQQGVRRKLVGLVMIDRGIARAGFPVLKEGRTVGKVTSGSYSPTLEKNIALAYVSADLATVGEEMAVEVRGQPLRARIVPTPFYRRQS